MSRIAQGVRELGSRAARAAHQAQQARGYAKPKIEGPLVPDTPLNNFTDAPFQPSTWKIPQQYVFLVAVASTVSFGVYQAMTHQPGPKMPKNA